MEKIRWSDRISNDEVLTIVNEERCLIETITRRKKNRIGHVLIGDELFEGCAGGNNGGKETDR